MDVHDVRLVKEKHAQLDHLLGRLDADAWLVFCREGSDPVTWLIAGHPMVGEALFLFTADGKKAAVVANYDALALEELGVFDELVAYGLEGPADHVRALVDRLRPARVALDYSTGDYLADGLSHGMYLRLAELLGIEVVEDAPSAECLVAALRAKKSPEERARIEEAVQLTETIFDELAAFAGPGMTELDVEAFIRSRQAHYGVEAAFGEGGLICTGRVGIGHRTAGPYPLEPGDVLSVDMGVRYKGYCSDLTRTFYIPRAGESRPPAHVAERFEAAMEATHRAIGLMAPGRLGHEVDAVAREELERRGMPVYPNALGHQIGRRSHDGGGLLAPLVPRYGDKGRVPLEEGNVFTVEPFIYGRTENDRGHPIGLEENVVVTGDGVHILSRPQRALTVLAGKGAL